MSSILTIAAQEIRMGVRNRWVLAISSLMAVLALAISLLGSAPTGLLDVDALSLSTVSLSSLSVFLIPLIALLLSYDALVGEIDQGTMLLLLSYPISRSDVVIGKFVGQVSIISFATIFGYGLSGVLTAMSSDVMPPDHAWWALMVLVLSSIVLGAIFIALGLMCSAMARNRGIAAGGVVALWLFFVIIFDLLLLGSLVSGADEILSAEAFSGFLLANPTDIFRMINMGGISGSGLVGGMAEVSASVGLPSTLLWSSMLIWCAAPLAVGAFMFNRRDI